MNPIVLYLLIFAYAGTCLFLILTILLQSGKGGGLSSLGSGGAGGALSDTLGQTGAEKTLAKATSWTAGVFLLLSVILTIFGAERENSGAALLGGEVQGIPAPATAPAGAPGAAGSTAPGASSTATTTKNGAAPIKIEGAATDSKGQPIKIEAGANSSIPIKIETKPADAPKADGKATNGAAAPAAPAAPVAPASAPADKK